MLMVITHYALQETAIHNVTK